MSRIQITEGIAQLRDVLVTQDGTYVQVASDQGRPVYQRSEPAYDDEVDVSVAERCSNWLRIATKLSSRLLELRCKSQRAVVEEDPLFVRIRELGLTGPLTASWPR